MEIGPKLRLHLKTGERKGEINLTLLSHYHPRLIKLNIIIPTQVQEYNYKSSAPGDIMKDYFDPFCTKIRTLDI